MTTTTTSVISTVAMNATSKTTAASWALAPTNTVTINRVYQIGYSIIFLLGFPGNLASLFTFSRPTLRKVSTGCLFIVLAASDTLYLLVCIFDYIEFGFQVKLYGVLAYDGLCRFRYFVYFTSEFVSAWILVIISIDRWIRTRFPFKSGTLCTPKKALAAVGVLLLIGTGLHAHMLSPQLMGFVPGLAGLACGPNPYNGAYVTFFFMQWTIIEIVLTCIVPASLMFLFLLDILFRVRLRKKAVAGQNQAWETDQSTQRKRSLQRQMFILMFGSICIFFFTSLPVGIYKIAAPRETTLIMNFMSTLTVYAGLGCCHSLLYAVSFYIHCLSSTLFRKEFQTQVKLAMGQKPSRVNVIELTQKERPAITQLGTRKL